MKNIVNEENNNVLRSLPFPLPLSQILQRVSYIYIENTFCSLKKKLMQEEYLYIYEFSKFEKFNYNFTYLRILSMFRNYYKYLIYDHHSSK